MTIGVPWVVTGAFRLSGTRGMCDEWKSYVLQTVRTKINKRVKTNEATRFRAYCWLIDELLFNANPVPSIWRTGENDDNPSTSSADHLSRRHTNARFSKRYFVLILLFAFSRCHRRENLVGSTAQILECNCPVLKIYSVICILCRTLVTLFSCLFLVLQIYELYRNDTPISYENTANYSYFHIHYLLRHF